MRVPLFGLGMQGKSPKITSQRRQNLYYEIIENQDSTRIAIYGTPGLELFVDFGDTPIRGLYALGDYLYAVHRGTFWEINNAGTKTSRGTLNTTSGRVDISDNGTQITVTDGTDGYTYTVATTTFATISDAQFPTTPSSNTFHDSYTVVSLDGTNQFQISDNNDSTAWDAGDIATAESTPGAIVRVVQDHDQVIFFKTDALEFWQNTGNADFPYAPITGAQQEWGLAAKWSVAKFDNSLAFLAKNKQGESMIARLSDYQVHRLSDFEWESKINRYSSISDATAFSYMLGGHAMYQISFPTQDVTWLYDGSNGLFHELKSDGITRHRAETHAHYLEQNMVGDYANGKVYKIKPDVYTDNGSEIQRQIVGRHFFDDDVRVRVFSLELIMEAGVGLVSGQGSEPQAMLEVSHDGGKSWSNVIFADIGKIGEYQTRVIWTKLGSARDWTFRITISDPIKVAIVGVNIKSKPGVS